MIRYPKIILSTAAALTAVAFLTSCKGRTVENIEPTGETIEVTVDETSRAIEAPAMPPVEADTSIASDNNTNKL